jgi:hypothetical protein
MKKYKGSYKPRFYLPNGEKPGDYIWAAIRKGENNASK